MLEPELQNIIETHKDLSELLEDDYLIRDRIFTGDEVLEILEKYISDTDLEEAKEKIEEKLDELKNLAIKYSELRNKKEEKIVRYDEKIGLIIKELKQYKGEFVDRLLKKISEI